MEKPTDLRGNNILASLTWACTFFFLQTFCFVFPDVSFYLLIKTVNRSSLITIKIGTTRRLARQHFLRIPSGAVSNTAQEKRLKKKGNTLKDKQVLVLKQCFILVPDVLMQNPTLCFGTLFSQERHLCKKYVVFLFLY